MLQNKTLKILITQWNHKMSMLNHPDFYKFFRRKMRSKSKIRNKERMGYRGPKQRYSVWRAEYNKKWEEYERKYNC